jgi:hypothetical protein
LVEEIQAEFNQRLETESQVMCFPVEARTPWELYRGSGSGEAHRSYIVVPNESLEEDIARLDALCRTLGAGLILFNSSNPGAPQFEIRVRGAKHEPDMFYVNTYMKLVEEELFA